MDDFDWKIIDTLYRITNITQAAEVLFLTQPTLSKKLKRIEKDLGVQLVYRRSKGVVFTSEGTYVANQASKLLHQFDDIRNNLLQLDDGKSGVIQLGMTNAFARHTIAPFLLKYRRMYPNINFDILTDYSTDVVEKLRRQLIQIGFVRGDFNTPFEKYLLAKEQAYLANKYELELKDLPQIPQIHYLKDPFAQKILDEWWYDNFSIPPTMGMNANHGDTCREMVLNGLGYGIFLDPDFISSYDNIFKLPLYYKNGLPFTRNCWMIWRKELYEIPIIRNFIDYIFENNPTKI